MQDKKIKILAAYLPQFHRTPENDAWWGEGFTDWVAAKNAKPLFPSHVQPKIPLNNNYYNLDNIETIRWQANLAKKYGVYGFAIYHYWFSSKQQLLAKPAELLLENRDIDTHYMFIWDNNSWKRTWSKLKANDWSPIYDNKGTSTSQQNSRQDGLLAELIYGDEKEWKAHFDYLLPFFKDERYVKINNKPLFGFYQPRNNFPVIRRMAEYWDKLAKEVGFNGIICMTHVNRTQSYLEYKFVNHPLGSLPNFSQALILHIKIFIAKILHKLLIFNYDSIWKKTLKNAKKSDSKTFLCGTVSYDDTPRRGIRGRIFYGATPQKFQHYLTELLRISKKQGKEYMFVTAWNEWGEGMCLEPDEENGYGYLEALQSALNDVNGESNN